MRGEGGEGRHLPDRAGLTYGPRNFRERPREGLGAGPVPPHGHSTVGAGPAGAPQPDGPSSEQGDRSRGARGALKETAARRRARRQPAPPARPRHDRGARRPAAGPGRQARGGEKARLSEALPARSRREPPSGGGSYPRAGATPGPTARPARLPRARVGTCGGAEPPSAPGCQLRDRGGGRRGGAERVGGARSGSHPGIAAGRGCAGAVGRCFGWWCRAVVWRAFPSRCPLG